MNNVQGKNHFVLKKDISVACFLFEESFFLDGFGFLDSGADGVDFSFFAGETSSDFSAVFDSPLIFALCFTLFFSSSISDSLTVTAFVFCTKYFHRKSTVTDVFTQISLIIQIGFVDHFLFTNHIWFFNRLLLPYTCFRRWLYSRWGFLLCCLWFRRI